MKLVILRLSTLFLGLIIISIACGWLLRSACLIKRVIPLLMLDYALAVLRRSITIILLRM